MTVKNEIIIYTPEKDINIVSTCFRAEEISLKKGRPVAFRFNCISLKIDSNTSAGDVMKEYEVKLQKELDAYNGTPEGIVVKLSKECDADKKELDNLIYKIDELIEEKEKMSESLQEKFLKVASAKEVLQSEQLTFDERGARIEGIKEGIAHFVDVGLKSSIKLGTEEVIKWIKTYDEATIEGDKACFDHEGKQDIEQFSSDMEGNCKMQKVLDLLYDAGYEKAEDTKGLIQGNKEFIGRHLIGKFMTSLSEDIGFVELDTEAYDAMPDYIEFEKGVIESPNGNGMG